MTDVNNELFDGDDNDDKAWEDILESEDGQNALFYLMCDASIDIANGKVSNFNFDETQKINEK